MNKIDRVQIDKVCKYPIYSPLLLCLITLIVVYIMVYILFDNYLWDLNIKVIELEKENIIIYFSEGIKKIGMYFLFWFSIINVSCIIVIYRLKQAVKLLKGMST
jgi:hypothetical protein